MSGADQMAETEAAIKGCIGGIGAMVDKMDGKLQINRVVSNGPAERAGFRRDGRLSKSAEIR